MFFSSGNPSKARHFCAIPMSRADAATMRAQKRPAQDRRHAAAPFARTFAL